MAKGTNANGAAIFEIGKAEQGERGEIIRTLAYYKGAEMTLRQSLKTARNPEYKIALLSAIHFARNRIVEIEHYIFLRRAK